MGFWQGLNAGFKAVQEEQTRKKERQEELDLRKAERDEERQYQRELWNEKVLFDQANAIIPLLVERQKGLNALAEQRKELGSFLGERLEDVPEETRTAFTNLALQDPTYSEALIEAVQKTEGPDGLGRRMTGAEILKMSRLFEQTKPEDVSIEDWTRQAATMTVTTDSGIDFDSTLERIISGDVTLEELQKTKLDLMLSGTGTANIRQDFDYSAVMGGDPQTALQLKNLAVDAATTQFQAEYAAVEQEAEAFRASGEAPSEEWQQRYSELGRIAAIGDAEEREAAIFNFYAPTILPRLAEREPRYKTMFPEAFQTAEPTAIPTTINYEYVNGKLVPVTR